MAISFLSERQKVSDVCLLPHHLLSLSCGLQNVSQTALFYLSAEKKEEGRREDGKGKEAQGRMGTPKANEQGLGRGMAGIHAPVFYTTSACHAFSGQALLQLPLPDLLVSPACHSTLSLKIAL